MEDEIKQRKLEHVNIALEQDVSIKTLANDDPGLTEGCSRCA